MKETAYAKINLALHVRGRRDDGYHELETLFMFLDNGDQLSACRSEQDELRVVGDFASELTDPFSNIVAKALSVLSRSQGLAVELEKNLPVAAGLGGGSADAGAIFRLVREVAGLPDDWHARAARLGADVPACVDSVACIGRGTGAELQPVENDLVGRPVLLVNPRVPLPTGPVFAAWDGRDLGGLPNGPASRIAAEGRNDLEAAALSMCGVIGEVLDALASTRAELVRMSGSGATCFAMYRDHDVMQEAADRLRLEQPNWWQMRGSLR